MTIQNRILTDISVLSAGSIASISGLTHYDDIDRLRARFCQFACGVLQTEPTAFSSWMDAWARFVLVEADLAMAVAEGRGVHTPALDFSVMGADCVTHVLDQLEQSGCDGASLPGIRFLKALRAATCPPRAMGADLQASAACAR